MAKIIGKGVVIKTVNATPIEKATQAEVNLGVNDLKYVTPLTLENDDKWATKANTASYIYRTTTYTVTNTDNTVECSGTFTVTLPTLSSITHREDITIKNSGAGVITVTTTGGELLEDVTTFTLYEAESITIQKGNTKYIIK